MTLASVVRDVCAVVGVELPSSIFSGLGTNRTNQEMLALANEMAQRIAYDSRDWTLLRKTVTYHGDGTLTAFNLPVDYRRMLLNSNVWRSTSPLAPMRFVPDTDQWLNRRNRNIYGAWGEWTIMGGQILIAPAMGPDVTAYFPYLHKNCIATAVGGESPTPGAIPNTDHFTTDFDRFVLDERLLKLGMIWQWKAQKGSPYAEDMGTYQDALASIAGRDSPAPVLIDREPISASIRAVYPFSVPAP
jgi:hypothetical protein